MIEISNNGALLASTNYWESEHASAGLCFLSCNAGTARLLVPEAAEGLLIEMRTGKSVTIEPSISAAGCLDLVFEDGTDAPFCLSVDLRQVDRRPEAGRKLPLVVWTERGIALELEAVVM